MPIPFKPEPDENDPDSLDDRARATLEARDALLAALGPDADADFVEWINETTREALRQPPPADVPAPEPEPLVFSEQEVMEMATPEQRQELMQHLTEMANDISGAPDLTPALADHLSSLEETIATLEQAMAALDAHLAPDEAPYAPDAPTPEEPSHD